MARLKLKISSRLERKKDRRQSYGDKHCRFCGNKDSEGSMDYKNINLLRNFLTERGKILPSRVSGTCFLHQRKLSNEIKIARIMALLPYCPVHK